MEQKFLSGWSLLTLVSNARSELIPGCKTLCMTFLLLFPPLPMSAIYQELSTSSRKLPINDGQYEEASSAQLDNHTGYMHKQQADGSLVTMFWLKYHHPSHVLMKSFHIEVAMESRNVEVVCSMGKSSCWSNWSSRSGNSSTFPSATLLNNQSFGSWQRMKLCKTQ
ncbi:hypothetical protein LIER_37503 [Lithospermum erythrorhizon]|uniref:Uncharacterized protein n=1 Tax=Lithospermum erythrorhizon TaxID=34254 RepID=A0AAV3PMM2_LITER